MIPRLPLTALLVLVLSTLGPLASASPPDPGWIGGFYDGADGDDRRQRRRVHAGDRQDDVVAVEAHPVPLGHVALPARPATRACALAAPAVRAPPSA